MPIHRIEIDFALPVELTDADYKDFDYLVDRICKRNKPKGWCFWPAGQGSKPMFSKADAAFLGKVADPNAPDTGEPSFDDGIFHIDCSARPMYKSEIDREVRKLEERVEEWKQAEKKLRSEGIFYDV